MNDIKTVQTVTTQIETKQGIGECRFTWNGSSRAEILVKHPQVSLKVVADTPARAYKVARAAMDGMRR